MALTSSRCAALIILLPAALAAQNVITTIAGSDIVFTGDGQPASNVAIGYINGVATDSAGNIYFTDPLEHRVLRVSPSRIVSVVAGNGIAGYSGDGGPATSAALAINDSPENYAPLIASQDSLGGIAVDQQGNVYFGDSQRVRMVTPQGIITTIAGGGTKSVTATTTATAAALDIVNGLVLDSAGNLYFCSGNRVHKLTPGGTLTTIAGTGTYGFAGDGGPAVSAQLSQPLGLAFDAQGNLYVADGDVFDFAARIRRITPGGVISTIAGGGTLAPANGVAPLKLSLPEIGGLAVDESGSLYAFGANAGSLFKLSGSGGSFTTTTLVTSPTPAPFMQGVPASSAYVAGHGLFDNSGIAFDAAGNLYVGDSRDGYLCKIGTDGTLSVVAGNGNYGFAGDGGPPLGAEIQGPTSMTQGADGTIYFIDSLNARVRAISPAGIITTVLGAANFIGIATLEVINSIAADTSGNLYALLDHRIIELAANGTVTIIVNQQGIVGDTGDGGLAVNAEMVNGGSLVRDAAGNLYFTDPGADRIREVTVDGKIHTIAGNGKFGITADGATASKSSLARPTALLLDGTGGIYFQESPTGDLGGDILRYITPAGILKTIAGNGKGGFTGDGGPAVNAGIVILQRTGLALDKAGNLYFADAFNNRVRVVSPSGIINTYAGNGLVANRGDGGPPLSASLSVPQGLLFDAKGDLLISDFGGNRIRSILATLPSFAAAPAQLNFSAKSGGANTPPQRMTVSSPINGLAFSVTVTPGADWVVVGTTSGETPQIIDVRANPTSLAPGTYNATITISAPFANPSSQSVAVTFTVGAANNPKLAVDRTGLSYTFPKNPTTTLIRMVRISNAGSGQLAFTAQAQTATGGGWLSLSATSGSVTPNTPFDLVVTANPQGMAVGTYTGTVTISSPTTGDTDTIAVTLTVSSLDQSILLSHTGLAFTAVSGGGVIPPQRFAVTNGGRGTMNFTVSASTLSGGQQWLSATPASGAAVNGTSSPMVTVSVNQAGLAAGFYYGQVRIDAAGAANSPHVVTIALQVLAAGQDPGEVIMPTEIVVNAVQGAPSPGSQNLSVYNVSATPQTFVSTLFLSDSNDKTLFSPGSATLGLDQPTRIVVQPVTSSLEVGVHESQLTLQFSDGYIRRVGIRTIVRAAPPSTSASAAQPERDDAAGCTATQLIPVITTLGQSFGVPATFPASVESVVNDDCGNALNSGSVVASFSNGDPPLSLTSVQDGTWQTTWQAGQVSGPVTVTVTAIDPTRHLSGTRDVTGALGSSAPAPVLSAAVSGASFALNSPLSPGSIISLFGQNLGNGTASAQTLPLSTTLSDATVVMAGNPLPLIFGSNGQINAVVPAGINTNTNQQILVQRDNTFSLPISVDVAAADPAIFPYPLPGDPAQQAAIVNAVSYAVADPSAPVTAGNVIAIFCTGLGAVNPAVADGAGAPSSPPALTVGTANVTIGGVNAPVFFAGLAPGFVGLYQIDATVPSGVTPGSTVPVVLSIAGQTGPPLTIAVK